MNKIARQMNVIIVDDEKAACTNLANVLTRYAGNLVHIAGIAYNTQQAGALIDQVQPDAVFLDIEMPRENAFAFLERIYPFSFEVIFVTAYDEYAVKAFRLKALDYILKPINIDEVVMAVRRLEEKLQYKQPQPRQNPYDVLAAEVKNVDGLSKITLKNNTSFEIVDFNDILFVEASGSYSRFCFYKGRTEHSILMSHSISEYEETLPASLFFRVHKSYLVNGRHIGKLTRDEQSVVSVGSHELPVSRRKLPMLKQFLKNISV